MGKAACRSTYRYDSLAAEGSRFDDGRGRGPRTAVVVVASRERVRDVRGWWTSALVLSPIQCLFTPRLGSGGWPGGQNKPTTTAICSTASAELPCSTVPDRPFARERNSMKMPCVTTWSGCHEGWAGHGWRGHDGGRRCCLPASPRRPRHCLFRCLLPTCPHLVQI